MYPSGVPSLLHSASEMKNCWFCSIQLQIRENYMSVLAIVATFCSKHSSAQTEHLATSAQTGQTKSHCHRMPLLLAGEAWVSSSLQKQ
jgi:hypothetical protein